MNYEIQIRFKLKIIKYHLQMHNYKRVKKVSQGAFGTVYEFQNLNPSEKVPQKRVAIKQVYTSSPNVKRELQILKSLPSNENLLKTYDIIEEKFNTYIVMELGKYDLATYIEQASYPVSDQEIKKVAFQLLNGLKALHNIGYIHRDLKPGNVILTNKGQLKLCDFGSAVKCTQGQQYELQGFTRWYKAPEMLYGSRDYKFQVDVWSLGCILMQFATGQPYFDGKSEIQQLSMITHELGNPTSKNWPSMAKLPDFGKITFKPQQQKTIQKIASQRGISQGLSRFLKKMIRYEGRSSVDELLNDEYLQLTKQNQSNSLLVMPSGEEEKMTLQIKQSYDVLRKQLRGELKNC